MTNDGDTPSVQVAAVDASGVCLYLSTDAFVVWEDHVSCFFRVMFVAETNVFYRSGLYLVLASVGVS